MYETKMSATDSRVTAEQYEKAAVALAEKVAALRDVRECGGRDAEGIDSDELEDDYTFDRDRMVRIKHIGHGWFTNQSEETPLKFASKSEAREFLAASGEEKNIGIDWEII